MRSERDIVINGKTVIMAMIGMFTYHITRREQNIFGNFLLSLLSIGTI